MLGVRIVLSLTLGNALALTTAFADGTARTTGERVGEIADELADVIEDGINCQSVIGAQLAVGTSERLLVSRQFGVISPGCCRPVDDRTLFCIGSCSKPIVSACVMSLVDDGALTLDDPIDQWLRGFRNLKYEDGLPVERAPTVRELLAHRAGIYSQRRELTPEQERAIRDFRLSLAQAIAIIAKQPLIARPGTSFLYSGAGYCVLGRIAECASGRTIEHLLQSQLGASLGWTRTTFFPSHCDANVAVGGVRNGRCVTVHPESPHLLGCRLRFPLVGGSIHSTAEETARFARMMLDSGEWCGEPVLSGESYAELTSRQYDDGDYGLGWSIDVSDVGKTTVLNHGGALYSSRSLLSVNLADGFYVVAHWTLSDPEEEDIRPALRRVLAQRDNPQ